MLSPIGTIHFAASIIALVAGTIVIVSTKGTEFHRKTGYVYAISMTVLIVTAFMIYRLFGGFGVFHVAAVISGISLLGGMLPAILRKPEKYWLGLHFNFMYWSVMGLYAALVAEILTRLPNVQGFTMVAVATLAVMAVANIAYLVFKKRWQRIADAFQGKLPISE